MIEVTIAMYKYTKSHHQQIVFKSEIEKKNLIENILAEKFTNISFFVEIFRNSTTFVKF